MTENNNYRQRSTARLERLAGLQHLAPGRAAEILRGRARASNTARTYRRAENDYLEWCASEEVEPWPGTVEQGEGILVHWALRGLSANTIRTRFAGLRRCFRDRVGRQNVMCADRVVDCFKGILRTLQERPEQAPALTVAHIRTILRALPRERDGRLTVRALRDRALLLVMYAGAFRRSEVVELVRDDCVFDEGGVRLLLRRAKGDQEGAGQWVCVGFGRRKATCPVRALRQWIDASPGVVPVFVGVDRWGRVGNKPLSHKGVGHVVKALAASARLDWAAFSAHSLRAGITTDLNAAGVATAVVQERTRHRSVQMVTRYHRPESGYRTNFTRVVGL